MKYHYILFIMLISMLFSTSTYADNTTDSVKLITDEAEYDVELEDNPTAKAFLDLLPLEVDMDDLNSNEKFVTLNTTLTSKPEKVNQINSGDLMLYGDDCIVVFYESFNTSYEYTRIGHVKDFKKPENDKVNVKFVKK